MFEGATVIGTTLNARFSLDKELGRGGMGAVYRATDQVLQRSVAVKILKDISGEEVGKRLRLEACILARLLHDNIVRLYDFSEDKGTFYFIMEVVDGTSFSKRWKKIDLADRLRILAQTADALDYAHHQGVIHRDVKPANILLTSSDQAKLSDFGLSMLAGDAEESGIVRGTPHYMSPEQARGKKLDYRTDIYALGVILYECATGSAPFTGAPMTVMAQQVNAQPDPPRSRNSEISEELEAYILELMSKDPEARPSSGREVAARLRELADSGRLTASAQDRSSNGAAAESVSAEVSPSTRMTPAPSMRSISTPDGASVAGQPAQSHSSPATSASVAAPGQPHADSTSARDMIEAIEAEPVPLSPDERYFCGHYLAYLLGGSRRRGFLMLRPLDPRNADRARLLLAMTYLMTEGASDGTLGRAAGLLKSRIDVRPALSPILVAKYLASRQTPGRRKRFRQARQQLQLACDKSIRHLLDARGVLNPGMMPQVLDDLKRVAPEKTDVDDQLVERWNRVTEVWRGNPEFREAVLRYATKSAWRDPASALLWPEVVYPLIERARWQRKARSFPEALWDRLCGNFHIPDAGNRMDRVLRKAVPEQVAEHIEVALQTFVDEPDLGEEEAAEPAASAPEGPRLTLPAGARPETWSDLEEDRPSRGLVRLTSPDPVRFTLGELRALWKEGIAALRNPNPQARSGARTLPIGPYRLAVVASIRSRSAGQAVIQGLPNKQIEMLVPSFTGGGADTKPVAAIWLYGNGSMAITYFDHLSNQRYILWDAATNQQSNFDDPAELNHNLYNIGLEAPDQLDRALSKGFRPRNPV